MEFARTGGHTTNCPVPDKYSVCGLLLASSFTETFADLDPTSPGVNVTVIVQLAPGARVLGARGQLFVGVKSLAFAPEMAMLVIVCETTSLLVRTAVWAGLVVPWFVVCIPQLGASGTKA